MKVFIYISCLLLPAFIVQATPLYLEQVNLASSDEKKLKEAHKQIKEHSEIKLKEDIFVPPFHKQGEKNTTDKKPFCNTCHQQQPHSLNERKRSFLNMHSRYISCETCHLVLKNIQFEYRWLNFNNSSNEVSAKRITPFYEDEAVLIFSDHEFAKELKDSWDSESFADASLEKAKLKLQLHAPLNKGGPDCLDCHNNKEQLLDLKFLGYKDKDITKLQQHSIPRFFSRFTQEEQRLRMTDLLQ